MNSTLLNPHEPTDKPAVVPNNCGSAPGPIETSVAAFVLAALLLFLLPATNNKPLGKNVLPSFFILPPPSQVGAIGYILLIPVGAAAIAALVGIPHAVLRRFVRSPLACGILGWMFLAVAHIIGFLGAITIFGG